MGGTMSRILIGIALLFALSLGGIALAQDDERSRFVRFVERQISTPDRMIRLGRIEGALSSNVRISEITIADRRGVWLTIENAQLVWSRLALLRGRLSIESLTADAIRIDRAPLPAETDEPIEEGAEFALPSLPVAVRIDQFDIDEIDIAEGVIGRAARLSVNGAARLEDGGLDARLSVDRLDRPGSLQLATRFQNESRQLAIDLKLSEPAGGVLANALGVQGEPSLAFTVLGNGPLSDFTADISLIADDETLLSGSTTIADANGGLRFVTDVSGNIEPLVSALYQPLVNGGTSLQIDATRAASGEITIRTGDFKSGAAELTFGGAISADGVPTSLTVKGKLGRDDGQPLALPGGDGDATLGSADIDISLGDTAATTFNAEIAVRDLDTPFLSAPQATLTATGDALNLHDPESRSVTFTVTGRANDIASNDAGVANAVGSRLALDANGEWRAGQPVNVENASIETDTMSARFAGTVGSNVEGTYSLEADSLSAFSALADRELAGAISLKADGTVGFDGLFDLTVDATTNDLAVGVDAADGLLAGETTLAGRAARTEEGVSFQDFRLANPQLNLSVNGALSDAVADLRARLELVSLAAVDEKLSGALAADLAVTGSPSEPAISARVMSDAIDFGRQELAALDARFDGTLTRNDDAPADVEGSLSLNARYANEPVSVSARIASDSSGVRTIDDLSVQIVDATAEGSLTMQNGLFAGELDLNVPELARLAPLLLMEASGQIDARVTLSHTEDTQAVRLDGRLQDVEIASARLGFASIALSADDVLGVPVLDGRADIRSLSAGGFDVRTMALVASRQGEATDMTLDADLGEGTLSAEGRLERADDGFAATLSRFRLAGRGSEAVLESPARVSVGAEAIEVADARLRVGTGTITLGGTLGENFDFEATIDQLPLSLANLVKPDLGVDGVVSGAIDLEGTRDEPSIRGRVQASGVTASVLSERGIRPISLTASGSYQNGAGSLDQLSADLAGGTLTASGSLGETLDINAELSGLPLALGNAFVPDLALAGTVSGNAEITGSFEDPAAVFTVAVDNASAAPLRAANLAPAAANVKGRYSDGSVALELAEVTVGGGRLTASGTAGDRLDLKINLSDLPMAIANGFVDDLGLAGTLSGEATVTGRATRPSVDFTLSSPQISTSATRNAGLPTGSLNVAGRYDGTSARLDEAVLRIGGGDVRATGSIGDRLDLTVDITSLPVSLAGAFAPDLRPTGSLSGRVRATGSLARPQATFDLNAANLSAAPLASSGLSAVDVRANGRFANNRVTLNQATATGGGLNVTASGTVPLTGGGLNLTVDARAPLAIANVFLRERGASLDGDVAARAQISGSLSAPVVNGQVSSSNITFRDPQSNLVLSNGVLDASLGGDRVTIRTLSANLGEGTIGVTGSIGLSNGFPADLRIALRDARYADGQMFAATVSGDLTVTGPVAASPTIAGNITVNRAEITVPESFGGAATLIDVGYIGASRQVMETLRRARVGPYAERDEAGGSGATGLTLDVTVDAPARVFVRGRGIDAELGGRVRLTGPISNIAPVGQFDLIRGRIVILTQRIEFRQGSVTLIGDLNPTIYFVAETTANSITARVVVSGQANDPQITLESTPELPQDEVLAQIIFGRSINDLSAFQLAQLAAAAAELAGGGSGPGLLEQIRVFAGLDNLEIVTDDSGNTSAEAGRYIADNIYLGVRAGARSSGVTVNLDVTRNVKVRAEALTDETTLGIFFEHEY